MFSFLICLIPQWWAWDPCRKPFTGLRLAKWITFLPITDMKFQKDDYPWESATSLCVCILTQIFSDAIKWYLLNIKLLRVVATTPMIPFFWHARMYLTCVYHHWLCRSFTQTHTSCQYSCHPINQSVVYVLVYHHWSCRSFTQTQTPCQYSCHPSNQSELYVLEYSGRRKLFHEILVLYLISAQCVHVTVFDILSAVNWDKFNLSRSSIISKVSTFNHVRFYIKPHLETWKSPVWCTFTHTSITSSSHHILSLLFT